MTRTGVGSSAQPWDLPLAAYLGEPGSSYVEPWDFIDARDLGGKILFLQCSS